MDNTESLSIGERLLLMQVLPNESDYASLKIIRNLQSELSFSELELEELGIKIEGGSAVWPKDKDSHRKPVQIGKRARAIIEKAFIDLDKKQKLNNMLFPLYERFVEVEDGDETC